MKTFLKNIQSIGLVLIAGLIMPNAPLAQDRDVLLNGPDTTFTEVYTIGDDFSLTISPQSIGSGDLTWGIIDISDLGNTGLQMTLDGAPFVSTTTVTPDGTAEVLTITPDPSGTPIPTEDEEVYEMEFEVSNAGNLVDVTLAISVQRRPVSVVFVLDRSGSMGSPPHGGSGSITRMDILQTAASLFVNKLDAFNLDGDEAALTYFESTVDSPPPGFGESLTAIEGNAGNFTGEIETLTPGGSTAMGDGLIEGKNKLPFPTTSNRQFIFLFTDGEQNVGNMVNNTGTQAGTESLNNADNSIQIVTIGTGAAAGMAPANLLQAIADENTPAGATARYFLLQEEVAAGGSGSDFNTATSITNFFDEGFQSMLSGSSPQTVAVEHGTMPSQASATADFEINANINKILFELITPDQEPSFTIVKDGTTVNNENASVRYIYGPNNGTNSLLAVIDLEDQPASGISSEGIWTVNIRSGTRGGQPYQIKAQVDDHRLDYSFEISADDFKVEDVLQINVDIAYDNTPLEDADITAIILKPGDDLGDLLARINVKFDPDTSGDYGSVGYQKLLALIEDNPALVDSLNLQENTVNLTHTSDGNYEGEFSDTDVTGVYQVIARISGTNTTAGNYERLVRRTVYLRFDDPDPELSTQEYSQIGPNTVQLLYTPMYAVNGAHRFVGPGFANGFEITGTDVDMVTTTDNGDGSYTINLEVLNGNTDPDIQINLSGVDVYEGNASDFGDSGWLDNPFGIPLWLFILILLIILVIIWVIIKK